LNVIDISSYEIISEKSIICLFVRLLLIGRTISNRNPEMKNEDVTTLGHCLPSILAICSDTSTCFHYLW